ncbi:Heme/hemopexin-binding protein precursor [Rubripirellula reticaptiva]|uniref:Heme/hemopexin-binding protein n=2 Tax=Rubripirellula reticaptiva TaxID=2528013 RepID=A0A5C6EKK4_9BACT|nr:Heme/hemopexin-binding protein precursor [Rubripirellula reticaptiva]
MRRLRKNQLRSSRRRTARRLLVLLIASASPAGQSVYAQVPTGADVVAGQVAISEAGNALNIHAATTRAIVNWDSFSLGAGNVANFNLPDANSAILNRVTSPSMPSTIAGAVNSNGHVYLVNPSGIVVSSSGMVNTNGFTASTFDIANQDFMDGGALTFADNGSKSSIVNNGTIATGSGGAHLIANEIANHGTLTSNGGNITLSGGGRVTLDNGVTYVQPTLETLASGISPTAGLIQNTGTIRATGAATSGGEVYLVNPNGKIMHDGTIAAQNIASNGDTIGGHVQLEADEITLTQNSSIDARGTHGGGEVLVGGDWQGSGAMTQATTVKMEAGATIDASATVSGDGGKIVLWSDIHNLNSVTQAFGTLLARAGELLGNGGQIETSGHQVDTSGIGVDAGSEHGDAGHWLIDPYNYVIDAIAASNIVSALNSNTSVTVTTTANVSAFGSSGNSSDAGDITISAQIDATGTGSLTLDAARDIIISQQLVRVTGDGANINLLAGLNIVEDQTSGGIKLETGTGNIVLAADADGNGSGVIDFRTSGVLDFLTNGGDITFGGGDATASGYAQGYDASTNEAVHFADSSAVTIRSNGGDISLKGRSSTATAPNSNGAFGVGFLNNSSVTIDSGVGTILIEGISQQAGSSSSTGQGVYFLGGNTTIKSANITSDAIRIIGDASASKSTNSYGVEFDSNAYIHATGVGGGILIDGHAGTASSDLMMRSHTYEILANGGPISLLGHKADGLFTIGGSSNINIGSKTGTAVATSASDVTIQFDQYSFNGYSPKIATSGDVLW